MDERGLRPRDLYPLEFLSFIHDWLPSMHRLHAKHLVITLFIVKHRGSEIFEGVLGRERAIRLKGAPVTDRLRPEAKQKTNLYPLVPYEETVTPVIGRMEVIRVHDADRDCGEQERIGWRRGVPNEATRHCGGAKGAVLPS